MFVKSLKILLKWLNRNNVSVYPNLKKHRVNLWWWQEECNVGDALSPVVINWMLQRKNINPNIIIKKTKFLYGIGSIIGSEKFDADIWGSGAIGFDDYYAIYKGHKIVKYNIHAVRGPITAQALRHAGYDVPMIYGDPAILMPLIYSPQAIKKTYKVSLITHHKTNVDSDLHRIDVRTDDYKFFIDEILRSELIISSSLHGIILAEIYGVPAIFLNVGMDDQILKFYDWYFSTGRFNVKIALSISQALSMSPMELPQIDKMQSDLMGCFPYSLWEGK